MKKFILALAAVIGIALGASAQNAKLYVAYGGYTQMDGSDMHPGHGKVNPAWGAVTAGFDFKVAPQFTIGPSYTFSSASMKHYDSDCYYHVMMVNAKYTYYRNSIVNLYGHLGVGADITHQTYGDDDYENRGYFAFQASPLCADVAISRSASMFGELGYGAQGLLNVGFRFNL